MSSSDIAKHFYGSVLARFIGGETLIDNTNNGVEATSIPGWVESSISAPYGFGYRFMNGEHSIALKSVTFLIATFDNEPNFTGSLEVEVFHMGEDKTVPETPIAKRELHRVKVSKKESYIEVPLEGVYLEPLSSYAITVSAPNPQTTRILGFQVPNTAPRFFNGFEGGMPLMRNANGRWNEFFGNPYIWIQGWKLDDQTTNEKAITTLKTITAGLLGVITLAVSAILIFRK